MPAKKKKAVPLLMVAIGASAGGLKAITELLQVLPPTTGMAFVYVQHLSPDHESLLTPLLAKHTKMKVREVSNDVQVMANYLYVIPPDKEMNMTDGHIRLTPRPAKPRVNLPIDKFFVSLAATHQENVIGIILSGSASDGTLGLKAIKEAGGVTMAQDETAQFNSMPASAIASGIVDFILPPHGIAAELVRIAKAGRGAKAGLDKGGKNEIGTDDPGVKTILVQLQNETGVNFSLYKINTVIRRIQRRMLLHNLTNVREYARLLQSKAGEAGNLYQDLLINVTNFFREPEASQYLKNTVLPALLRIKKPGETLRIWVAACSTGQEAYSIAIQLVEIMERQFSKIPVQIFATDLSEVAITKARIGHYTKEETDGVSPKRLQQFFVKADGGYRIIQRVRDMCVFATHNILTDAPFSRMDMISCCNLLIYLDPPAQQKIVSLFHYALNSAGLLVLGKSETIGNAARLFAPTNKKYKIFGKQPGGDNNPDRIALLYQDTINRKIYPPVAEAVTLSGKKNQPAAASGFGGMLDEVLLSRDTRAAVIINRQMEIVQFRGFTDPFLFHPTGRASFQLFKMARPEIVFELRNAITKAEKTKQPVVHQGLLVESIKTVINIEVIPFTTDWNDTMMVVLFAPQYQYEKGSHDNTDPGPVATRKLKKLENEVAAYRDQLHTMVQNHEAAVEELQSANEEVVSTNEELRSINEELETSKEEIQSSSEEMASTNQELRTRNDLLSESYQYSEAIIATLHEPLIILDKGLRVKTANRSFYRKFNTDENHTEGFLFYELGDGQWNNPELRELLEDIVPKNTSFYDFELEQEFPVIGRKIFHINARRLKMEAHQEHLILIALSDMTDMVNRQLSDIKLLKDEVDTQTRLADTSNIQARELELAVLERTKQLNAANALLEEKNASLQKMNKELESFAFISSHDLQEPLRKIQTFASRIEKTDKSQLTSKGKDYLERMIKSASRMRTLIDDLLSFSRLGMDEALIEKTDLQTIVDAVKYELKESIDEQSAVIELTRICAVRIIPYQFQQLMQNLISNSLKFASPGRPPHIIITGDTVEKGNLKNPKPRLHNGYCHIIYTDNGIGFEPEFNEQVFDIFQRLHNRDEYPGNGIGLATAKKIIENHQGMITAEGTPGVGARFDIYLPL